jgi:hypothetical protein
MHSLSNLKITAITHFPTLVTSTITSATQSATPIHKHLNNLSMTQQPLGAQ